MFKRGTRVKVVRHLVPGGSEHVGSEGAVVEVFPRYGQLPLILQLDDYDGPLGFLFAEVEPILGEDELTLLVVELETA